MSEPDISLESRPQKISRRIDKMTDSQEFELQDQERAGNERADAIAALAILTIAILAGINYSYTGGLLAFIENVL